MVFSRIGRAVPFRNFKILKPRRYNFKTIPQSDVRNCIDYPCVLTTGIFKVSSIRSALQFRWDIKNQHSHEF